MKHDNVFIIGINAVDYGSTGTIMRNSLEFANKVEGYNYLVIARLGHNNLNAYIFGYKLSFFEQKKYHFYKRRLNFDEYLEIIYTNRVINKIKQIIKAEKHAKIIINLHNIHDCHINYSKFIQFLAKVNVKIYYTLHDAWAFTGGCYCFNYIHCRKWETGCKGFCPQNIGDKTHTPWQILKQKEKCFSLIKDKLTFICVSNWIKEELSRSFLKDYNAIVNPGECSMIPFKGKDYNLIEKLKIKNKKIILAVSAYWNDWKGVKYLYKIADLLPKDYILLVVGGKFDVKSYKNIIYIDNVENDRLNSYYSIADCFVSTTQDDNCPLVFMEAQICGLPIVGFGHGGTSEMIIEGKTGYMVGKDNNVNLLVEKIKCICENHPFKKVDIIKNGQKFAKYEHAKRMLEIYNNSFNL